MMGAIIGDIVGSRFEWHNYRHKDFTLFHPKCRPTDDSIMTLAVAKAILAARPDYEDLPAKAVAAMQELGRAYPRAGYGRGFRAWLQSDHPEPYNSFGNGSAMRVSPAGFAARTEEEAQKLSLAITAVTHNHPEGIKGAEAVAVLIYHARQGMAMKELHKLAQDRYYP
ncbi:ADP-ribosylglycohydrolase family protein, partial [Mitsuokella multacida]|uniref:ADP-ribosylglycohydrolase family protein n=1 Tax=Mitsuokella multacida TaxID=52226 RepID=UPI003FEE167A